MVPEDSLVFTDYTANVHDSDTDYMEFLRINVNESNPMDSNSSRPKTRLHIDKEAWSKMNKKQQEMWKSFPEIVKKLIVLYTMSRNVTSTYIIC